MKKITFFAVGIIVIIAICLYIGLDNKETPIPTENNTVIDTKSDDTRIQKTDTPTETELAEPKTEVVTTPPETEPTESAKQAPDWRTDEIPVKEKKTDPFSDILAEEQAKSDGISLEDFKNMTDEERRNWTYQQQLKKFGDIPEVHTLAEFQRKTANNMPVTLDEQIEAQKAAVHLYPNETNRRTLAVLQLMRSKGSTIKDITKLTPADVKELQGLGIDIQTETDGDKAVVTFSTK